MRIEGACREIGGWKQNVWPHACVGNHFPAAALFLFTRACAAVTQRNGLLQQGPEGISVTGLNGLW